MKQKQYFLIGLFVLSGFLLFVLGCILFGSADLFAKKLTFETYFVSSVQGLDVGSPVKFRGMTIGAIDQIGFAGTTYRNHKTLNPETPNLHQCLAYVHVVGHIDLEKHAHITKDELLRMIKHGLRARLELQGITGQLYINLDFLRRDSIVKDKPLVVPWEPEMLYLPSVPNTLQSFLSVAENISKELSEIDWTGTVNALASLATDVNKMLTDSNIPALVTSFKSLGDNLNRQVTTLHTLLQEIDAATFGQNLKDISSNLNTISADISETLPSLTKTTQSTLQDAEKMLAETTALIKNTNAMLTEVRSNLNSQVVGNELEATLISLSRTTASLELLINEIREKPSRLIFDDDLDE